MGIILFLVICQYLEVAQGCSFIIGKYKDDELCLGDSWFDKEWGNCTAEETESDDPDAKKLNNLCTENADEDGAFNDVLGLNQPLDTCVED